MRKTDTLPRRPIPPDVTNPILPTMRKTETLPRRPVFVKCYHRTWSRSARVILTDGFKDAAGTYLTANEYSGVWFSNVPLDANEGADGDVLLSINVPLDLFEKHEWKEDGKPYRESLMPAEFVNQYGPPAIEETDFDGCDQDNTARPIELMAKCKLPKQRIERAKDLAAFVVDFNR